MPHEDIDTVLKERLIPLDLGGTRKFAVDGRPDLFVRRNAPGVELEEADRGYMSLKLHGVDVLPYGVVQQAEGLYIITYKVDGQPLKKLMVSEQDEAIVEEIDSLYTQLGKFTLGAWRDGKDTVKDVLGACQYMYGSVNGGRPGIKLVDLDMIITGQVLDTPGNLTREAIEIANGIVETESALDGRKLVVARQMVRRLFVTDLYTSNFDPVAAALVRLGNTILTSGQSMEDHDDMANEEILEKYGTG